MLEILDGVKPTITIAFTAEEVALLLSALDSHEYWEHGHDLPRNNGFVWLPGDEFSERYWPDGRQPDDAEKRAIEGVERCRALAARLEEARRG